MISNLNKNVICIKNIPSNLIEEAFFVLKINKNELNEVKEQKRKLIIMNEINEIIKEYSGKFQIEKDKQRKKESEKRSHLKKVKLNILLLVGLLALVCIIIVSII